MAQTAALDLIRKLDIANIRHYPTDEMSQPSPRGVISEALVNADLLIDVHSFPYDGFGTNSDVIILEYSQSTWHNLMLFNMLKATDVKVAYMNGVINNDIVTEGRAAGVPSVLIEYNEQLSSERLSEIDEIVKQWVGRVLSRNVQ